MAVYTPLSADEIASFLAGYDLGDVVSFAGISAGVENTNYRVETSTGAFILTLFEARTRAEALPFCLALMAHMQDRGIRVAQAQVDRAGAVIASLKGRPSVLMSFLPGVSGDLACLTQTQARAGGATLGAMHRAAEGFTLTRAPSMDAAEVARLVGLCGARAHDLMSEIAWQREAQPATVLPTGAVHADFFPDNVLFAGDIVTGVIDFYFASTDVLIYDLMLALNAWGFTPEGTPDFARMTAFAQGYAGVRSLTGEERAALPFYARRAAARIAATRLYDALHPKADAVVTPKDPGAYLRILDFHRAVRDPAIYGFAS